MSELDIAKWSGRINVNQNRVYNHVSEEDMLDKITAEYGNNTSKTLGIEVKNGDTREANNIFVDDSNGYVRFIKHNGEFMELSSDDGCYREIS